MPVANIAAYPAGLLVDPADGAARRPFGLSLVGQSSAIDTNTAASLRQADLNLGAVGNDNALSDRVAFGHGASVEPSWLDNTNPTSAAVAVPDADDANVMAGRVTPCHAVAGY